MEPQTLPLRMSYTSSSFEVLILHLKDFIIVLSMRTYFPMFPNIHFQVCHHKS